MVLLISQLLILSSLASILLSVATESFYRHLFLVIVDHIVAMFHSPTLIATKILTNKVMVWEQRIRKRSKAFMHLKNKAKYL